MEARSRQAEQDGGEEPLQNDIVRRGQRRPNRSTKSHEAYQNDVKCDANPVDGRHV